MFSFFLCPWLIRGDYFFRTVYIGITLSYSRLQMWKWRWRYLSIALRCIYLPVFMKMNLTKFAVTWVKKGRRAGFLLPISSKITPVEGKKGEKERARNTLRLTEEVHFKTPARYIILIFNQPNSVVLTFFTTLFISTGSPFFYSMVA